MQIKKKYTPVDYNIPSLKVVMRKTRLAKHTNLCLHVREPHSEPRAKSCKEPSG